MVVVVEAGVGQLVGLLPGQHAERDAGLHAADVLHRPHQFGHLAALGIGGAAPGRTHAEARRAGGAGLGRRVHHIRLRQQPVGVQAGIVVDALGAVLAVLRTAPGLDAEQGADLHLVARMMAAMHRLGAKQQVVQRHLEQRHDLFGAPIMPDWVFLQIVLAFAGIRGASIVNASVEGQPADARGSAHEPRPPLQHRQDDEGGEAEQRPQRQVHA